MLFTALHRLFSQNVSTRLHSLCVVDGLLKNVKVPDSYKHGFPNKHVSYIWTYRKGFQDKNKFAAQAEKLITNVANPTSSHPDILEVARLSQQAVAEGSPRGKTLLGSLYREGLVVQKDYQVAERLFLEASEAGDPIAQCSLGVLKLSMIKDEENSDPDPVDFAVAVDDKGEMVASRVELSGVDVSTPAQIVREVRKARRKAGFSDAEAREYEVHREEQELKRRSLQRKEAYEWLQRAIDQGNDTAMMALANDIVREDTPRAVELYERAAKDHRNVDAYYTLGQIYEQGIGTVPVDLQASFKNFSMGAQLGDSSAQFYMGHLYHHGSFVVGTDSNTARNYIEMAVSQGHPGATFYYSLMHRNGECGLPENMEEFRRYLQQAADAGHGPALMCLGDMYYHGSDGVKKDYAQALENFTTAGMHGELDALCSAAAMHFHGTGTKKDRHKAFMLYQEAAVGGNVTALRNISSMYFYGHGVPVNKKLSAHFMEVADETEQRQNILKNEEHRSKIMTEDAPFENLPIKPKPRLVDKQDKR